MSGAAAGVDSVRERSDPRRREDMPLELGDRFEELLRRLYGGLHVRVDGPERLLFERLGRAVLLVGGGVLQHVQRWNRARERDMGGRRIVGQAHASRQGHAHLDKRPRPQEREVLLAVVGINGPEKRIVGFRVEAPRTLQALPACLNRRGREAEAVPGIVAGRARAPVSCGNGRKKFTAPRTSFPTSRRGPPGRESASAAVSAASWVSTSASCASVSTARSGIGTCADPDCAARRPPATTVNITTLRVHFAII